MILQTPTYISLDATSVEEEMENIITETKEKEHMKKNTNDTHSQQIDIHSNQQSNSNNSNTTDNSVITVVDAEEEEVQKTFQRKPQFRYNENNRRRFY